uniref:Cytidyltransferase-like domain-containing protein n=1 Tax=Neobodo designis TaxID=312471 RepID=A0A7S1KYQ4_NEODS|mmetsp:Transcript_10266/g.31723  ORF Transcript_10266/g.31723 Transcript_10266/m.31723 type:complete len:249 (+) Transcript_10266:3-749(+)
MSGFLARVAGVEAAANASALRAYLAKAKTPAPSVVLDITDAKAEAVLDHVTQLYNAASHVAIYSQVNVLLRAHEAGNLQPIRAQHLTEELGYDLHDHVAMGGTFDRLHVGHKVLLTYSVLHARHRLRIGVTGEELLKRKRHAELLQPFEERRRNVETFVRALRTDLAYDVVELNEPTGGTTTIEDLTAMVVSPETLPTVDAINAERTARDLDPVAPIVINYIGPDGEERVSSTALREAEAAGAAQSAE